MPLELAFDCELHRVTMIIYRLIIANLKRVNLTRFARRREASMFQPAAKRNSRALLSSVLWIRHPQDRRLSVALNILTFAGFAGDGTAVPECGIERGAIASRSVASTTFGIFEFRSDPVEPPRQLCAAVSSCCPRAATSCGTSALMLLSAVSIRAGSAKIRSAAMNSTSVIPMNPRMWRT